MKHLLSVFSVFFATLSLLAAPEWTCGAYAAKTTATTAEQGNLMRLPGSLIAVENNDPNIFGMPALGNTSVLKDGQMPCKSGAGNSYSVGDDAVMTITFSGKADVDSLCLWASHTDNHRCGVRILSVEASTEEGEVVSVQTEPYQKNIDPEADSGSFWYRLSNEDGTSLASGIKSLTITFGQMHNHGTLMEEVEVIGRMTAVDSYTVTFVNHEGAVLSVLSDVAAGADITAQAPIPPAREGYVFMGWSEDLSQITANLTVHPVYVEVGKTVWELKAWDDKTRPDYGDEINLFAQDGVTVDVVRGDGIWAYGDLSALTDGIITVSGSSPLVYTVGDNSSLTFTLPYAQDIGSFELYTHWPDGGRDGLKISKLEYKTSTDATEWTSIPLEALSFGLDNNGSLAHYYVRAYCPDLISPLAANAQVFRISIEKSDNKGTGIAEVRASRFITPQYAWSGESWDSSADVELPVKDTLLGDNLMRKGGAALSIITNNPHDSLSSCLDSVDALTDGILKVGKTLPGAVYPLGSGALVECRFDAPKDVRGIRLHTYFTSGARDGIAVRALYVQNYGEDFFRRVDFVAPWSYGVGDDASSGALSATLSAPEGESMFSRITALRLEFGTLDHTCSTFSEIEVFGRSASRPLAIRIR